MHIIKCWSLKTITIKITKLYVYTVRLFDTIFFKNQRIGRGGSILVGLKVYLVIHEAWPTSSCVDNVAQLFSSSAEEVV